MVLALKSHLLHNHHQLSSNSFSSIVRSHQTPLFQVQPIQTTSSLSPLQLKPRRKSIIGGFNASSYVQGLERSGGSGGGVDDTRKERRGGDGDGGGGVNVGEVVRLFLRFADLLMGPDQVIVGAVGLPAKLALLCVQAMWQLHLAMMEMGNVILLCICAGGVLISAVITFLFFQFV
ncbi:hypothetical protein Hanom_Chr07g00667731 [Helianthus anomalus]